VRPALPHQPWQRINEPHRLWEPIRMNGSRRLNCACGPLPLFLGLLGVIRPALAAASRRERLRW
jgi:hypothetical protein